MIHQKMHGRKWMKPLRFIGITLLALLVLLMFLWAIGAIYYDGPFRAFAWVNAIAVIAGFRYLKSWKHKLMAFTAWFGIVLVAWHWQRPSNEGDWQPDVAQLAYAEIDGDVVTFHNVRAFDYRTKTDFTPRWKTRSVRLSQLTGIDLVVNYWGSPWMAHPIASFQFADQPPICVSIETRRKNGQSYSAIGGLYRQFTLIYTVSEETDVIRLRTNIRSGEDCYIYRLNITADHARERFLEYVNTINQLHEKPRWYNAITTNCTTAIRKQRDSSKRIPFDWRMLVNGKGDEMLYERDYILKGGLPFEELKRRSHINAAARTSAPGEDFSRNIRAQMPW
jgi:hypothetical protein